MRGWARRTATAWMMGAGKATPRRTRSTARPSRRARQRHRPRGCRPPPRRSPCATASVWGRTRNLGFAGISVEEVVSISTVSASAAVSARGIAGSAAGARVSLWPTHPEDNIRANGTSQKWTFMRMLPDSGGILRRFPLWGGALCPNVVSRVARAITQMRHDTSLLAPPTSP